MFFMVQPLFYVISLFIDVYLDIVVIEVILSWLIHFNILKLHTRLTQRIMLFFEKVTHPVYAVIRQKIPPVGPIDFSPLILFVILLILGTLVDKAALILGA